MGKFSGLIFKQRYSDNLVDKVSKNFDKPTVYNYSNTTLYIDPAANIKKIEKTGSDEKPKEWANLTKKKKPKTENLSGISSKVA